MSKYEDSRVIFINFWSFMRHRVQEVHSEDIHQVLLAPLGEARRTSAGSAPPTHAQALLGSGKPPATVRLSQDDDAYSADTCCRFASD